MKGKSIRTHPFLPPDSATYPVRRSSGQTGSQIPQQPARGVRTRPMASGLRDRGSTSRGRPPCPQAWSPREGEQGRAVWGSAGIPVGVRVGELLVVMEKVDPISYLLSNLRSGRTLPGQDVKIQVCFGEESGFRVNDKPMLFSTLGCVC